MARFRRVAHRARWCATPVGAPRSQPPARRKLARTGLRDASPVPRLALRRLASRLTPEPHTSPVRRPTSPSVWPSGATVLAGASGYRRCVPLRSASPPGQTLGEVGLRPPGPPRLLRAAGGRGGCVCGSSYGRRCGLVRINRILEKSKNRSPQPLPESPHGPTSAAACHASAGSPESPAS